MQTEQDFETMGHEPMTPIPEWLIIEWVKWGSFNVTTNDWQSHIDFVRHIEKMHHIK